jgi:hypothetical protein
MSTTSAQSFLTDFAYPKGVRSIDLRFSRKGRTLAEAMGEYANPRLLPKLEARTAGRPDCNHHDYIDAVFVDACVYLRSWLGHGDVLGIAEFPFARLYPIKGGRYNLSVRRLYDWSRAEDVPLTVVLDTFWNQAPNAKYWVKVAQHKTFEECVDLLVKEPTF